ncbi:MAG: hypothetical protein FWG50_07270 [Kiritimatiellaeota bacterium]|nr:hypothetical protein [Kiritimatiellota bacterium]
MKLTDVPDMEKHITEIRGESMRIIDYSKELDTIEQMGHKWTVYWHPETSSVFLKRTTPKKGTQVLLVGEADCPAGAKITAEGKLQLFENILRNLRKGKCSMWGGVWGIPWGLIAGFIQGGVANIIGAIIAGVLVGAILGGIIGFVSPIFPLTLKD